MDAYLRDRAEKLGANIVNGLMMKMEQPGGWAVTLLIVVSAACHRLAAVCAMCEAGALLLLLLLWQLVTLFPALTGGGRSCCTVDHLLPCVT
jgi:hypothetical protein